MKKNQKKWTFILGIIVLLLMLASSWHAVNFNESRIVAPMDYSTYTFRVKDLPMICSIGLACLYCIYLIVLIIKTAVKTKKMVEETQTTRKISPMFGMLGFFGFLGFLGFYTYSANNIVSPFVFFVFFGFFGFFYEGKMSGMLMDERYKQNVDRAQLNAFKIAFVIMCITLSLIGSGRFFGNLEYTLIAMIIMLSLAAGLALFLSEYLLYRYDHDGQCDESEE